MLNKTQLAFLRKEAQKLDKPYLLGKGEVDDTFLKSLDAALTAKELIKVRLLSSSVLSIKDVAARIATSLGAETVLIIGHTATFYRPSKKRIYFK